MIELECEKVLFHSPQDEAAFFAWSQAIPAVTSVVGRGSSIILTVKSKRVADTSLRELLALFRRYRISMPQLAQFRNANNEAWFASPEKYWFKSVFGR
ncbi:MAG: hypothetical protein MSG64_08935 [Pyrinomonadaceae bacterium MAG19_C2-C3]|nr:hypothetical protein [Pyrinomonadaceae bacterium MAG19_C2-C3]